MPDEVKRWVPDDGGMVRVDDRSWSPEYERTGGPYILASDYNNAVLDRHAHLQRAERALAERDRLAAELAEVRATVSEWACENCRCVYPGPPQAGLKCVVCPQCGGSTMPHELLRTREAEAERDRLRAALERIAGEPAEYYANIARSALRTERGAGQTAIPATAVPGLTSGEPGAAQGITGQSHKMCLHPKACRAGPDGYCGECHQACYP